MALLWWLLLIDYVLGVIALLHGGYVTKARIDVVLVTAIAWPIWFVAALLIGPALFDWAERYEARR